MKNIVLTAQAHMAAADCEGIEFERGVAQLVDDAKADVILRNEWFAEVPAQAEKPAGAPRSFAAPVIARPDAPEAT